MGVYHDDNVKEQTAAMDAFAGKAVSGYWDRCERAGPKSRAATGFHRELPALENLSVTDGEIKLLDLIQQRTVSFNNELFRSMKTFENRHVTSLHLSVHGVSLELI